MKNKIIFITPELALYDKTDEIIAVKNKAIFQKNPLKQLQEIDIKQEIYIYDKGFNKTNKVISINNHVNKTGTNPLREGGPNKIDFYDITNIYQKTKQGKTAECFGNKLPTKEQKKNYIQGRFLCNYAILANYVGFIKIYAFIID